MKILVVDDERDVEPLFRMRFRREIAKGEIELIFAFSGEEALEMLSVHNQADVVLVLSDINMPGMTGLELLGKIKQNPPPVPVCMMTAYDNDDYRARAEALACDGYVSKPIDFKALKDTVYEFAANQ
jgi:CheY-like chemotaxis protein